VFTNSEISLKHVDVYGFDFDYTLLQYTPEVHKLIYAMARKRLVEKLSYPHGIEAMPFDPDFAIRGLHCDVSRGLLMKIDAYNHIHLSSVHRGHQQLNKGDVLGMYGGTHIPLRVTDHSWDRRDSKMVQFLDLFSIPEATLFADVMEYVSQREKQKLFPKYLFEDVQNTVREIHAEGLIHDAIIEDIERYTKRTPRLPEFLNRLRKERKKLFLITNSPYWFVNAGMTHALGSSDWRELFDVVVVQAMKPSFYTNSDRPFRMLHPRSLNQTWEPVSSLEQSQTYIQGNVRDFIRMTGWTGYRVLYFGDHVFSDLADPIMQLGWKTGAIIPELKTEMERAFSPEAKRYLAEMLALEKMLNSYQECSMPDLVAVMSEWKKKRTEARRQLKVMFNPRFGSVFRTEKSPTYFSLRLSTFANLYMASLDNLMNYSLDHTFIPRRTALPHEPDLNFDLKV
jgi:HAD superfamily 5'-nucleotidase-like hydrolase